MRIWTTVVWLQNYTPESGGCLLTESLRARHGCAASHLLRWLQGKLTIHGPGVAG